MESLVEWRLETAIMRKDSTIAGKEVPEEQAIVPLLMPQIHMNCGCRWGMITGISLSDDCLPGYIGIDLSRVCLRGDTRDAD